MKYDGLTFYSFNQDCTCISAATRSGYRIYNCDPFGKCYARADGGISIVEMLFCTSLVALVGIGDQPAMSPRRLQIVNTKRDSVICELTFPTAVIAVKMNRKRLVVVLEEHIHVYNISNMKLLHSIETSPNPAAVCSLSSSSEKPYLAYPSPSSTTAFSPPLHAPPSANSTTPLSGSVAIFDTLKLQVTHFVEAHKSSLSVLALSSDGTLLATASDKGTIIRVFSVPDGQKLFQFRRGTYPARIYSMSFNLSSAFLCVSSATETVHVFKISRDRPAASARRLSTGVSDVDARGQGTTMAGILRRSSHTLSAAVGGYLPNTITEMWEPTRDFAFVKLPGYGARSVVAMGETGTSLLVLTSDGYFYQYQLNLETGGECTLQKQFSLLQADDSLNQD